MKALKQYGWVLSIIGAALLVGLALFLEFANGEDIVVPFIGGLIILSAGIRLVPYVKTQNSDLVKTINIIEITIDVAIGLALILIQLVFLKDSSEDMGPIFGYLIGVYLMLRGSVHFFGISQGKEVSDIPIYFFHIAALIVGSLVFFSGDFEPALLIHIILAFSIVTGGYFTYSGYKGYKVYRYQKTLMMPDQATADEPMVEKRVPVHEEKEIDEPVQDIVS